MEARELRPLNLVQTNYEGILEVINITSQNNFVECRKPQFMAIGRFNLNSVQPIPLTEEWLVKMGLHEGRLGYYFLGDFMINVDGHVYFGETETWIAEIYSVHQLQNLYYALTNEELTIN
jgi:hypothetical protein